jgi:homoserine O-acetyltransferase
MNALADPSLDSEIPTLPFQAESPVILHAGAAAHAGYHHRVQLAAPFVLESGQVLEELHMVWCAYGNEDAPVIWVSHALTANANVAEWWPGLFGEGHLLDPTLYRIICPNILGSCYGSTGPASAVPGSEHAYGRDFPLITVRDQARAQALLMEYLGLESVFLLIGGSLGGMQAMELAISGQVPIEHLVLLACPPKQSAWAQAWNEAQRLALGTPASEAGLAAARSIAMLSYRTYGQFVTTQTDPDPDRLQDFAATTYQRYQGQKLVARFDPETYRTLALAMDTHAVARGKTTEADALAQITARTLVIGISSDNLFPVVEQQALAEGIPNADLVVIHSPYGHDGFLTESAAIEEHALAWFQSFSA